MGQLNLHVRNANNRVRKLARDHRTWLMSFQEYVKLAVTEMSYRSEWFTDVSSLVSKQQVSTSEEVENLIRRGRPLPSCHRMIEQLDDLLKAFADFEVLLEQKLNSETISIEELRQLDGQVSDYTSSQ